MIVRVFLSRVEARYLHYAVILYPLDLPGASTATVDMSSMNKFGNSSQTNPAVPANLYGGQGSAYMSHGASHLIPHPMQSQLTSGPSGQVSRGECR